MPTIPVWVPPVTDAPTLNQQRLASETAVNIIGDREVIPILFGDFQVGGRIFAIDYDESTETWTVGFLWGWGEIEAIDQVWINGEEPLSGVLQNDYTGTTSQTADSLLSAAIAGYTDTLVVDDENGTRGLAYSVLQWTDTQYPNWPEVVAEGRGLKMYDSRVSGHLDNDASTWEFSRCPALAWRTFVTDPFFGPAESVNDASVEDTADDNDATVSTEARRQIGLVMDERLTWEDWRRVLETYCSAWGFKRGDEWHLVSDRPRSVDFTIDETDMVPKTFKTAVAPLESIPTHVRVWYTDTTETIWRERFVEHEVTGVSSGSVERRSSEVRMPGIVRATQAKREAIERLKKLQRFLQAEVQLYDDHIGAEVGDVLDVSHPRGYSNVEMRVIPYPELPRIGRPKLRLVRYSSDDYDDTETAVSFNDTTRFAGTAVGKRAQLGKNVFDENDATVSDDDALNDRLIGNSANNAGGLAPNPNLTMVSADGRPVGVYGFEASSAAAAAAAITYGDANRNFLRIQGGSGSANARHVAAAFGAFRLEPGVTAYRVFIRVRAANANSNGTLYIRMAEIDTELNLADSPAIGREATGADQTGHEINILSRAREVELDVEDEDVGTSWVVKELLYEPTSTAKWASLNVFSWDSENDDSYIDVDWHGVLPKRVNHTGLEPLAASKLESSQSFSTTSLIDPGGLVDIITDTIDLTDVIEPDTVLRVEGFVQIEWDDTTNDIQDFQLQAFIDDLDANRRTISAITVSDIGRDDGTGTYEGKGWFQVAQNFPIGIWLHTSGYNIDGTVTAGVQGRDFGGGSFSPDTADVTYVALQLHLLTR